MTKRQKFFSALGRFFKELFTKNIFLKVVALLFAILLWGYVLSIENPEYTKRVRDVPIGIVGESTLNANGLMLVSHDLGTTDVDVLCRINKHSTLDANVTCTVDLTSRQLTLDPNENSKVFSFDVTASVPADYGTVQNNPVDTVELEIARVSTRNNVQVNVKFKGRESMPAGYTVEAANTLYISMTGRKSLLDQVNYGEVEVDLSELTADSGEDLARTYDKVLPIQFYDGSNAQIDDIVTSDGLPFTTNVRVVIRAYKEVDIKPSIQMLEEGYNLNYTLSRSKVVIFGERADLDKIDSIQTETIAATPQMNNTPISATLIIPDGVELASGTSKTVTVTVLVQEKTDQQTYEIPVTYGNLTEGTALDNDIPKTVSIEVSGTLSKLAAFRAEWVQATVDCGGYLEGKVTLPVRISTDSAASGLKIVLLTETVEIELIRIIEES